jgi:polyisoprenoid-binding protein YceI
LERLRADDAEAMSLTSPHPPLPTALAAHEHWSLDAERSSVGFRVRHLGVATVRGSFEGLAADARRVDGRLEITGSVRADTVASGSDIRDTRLRNEFFGVDAHPTIAFHGSLEEGAEMIEGELTIRDVRRPVRLELVRRELLADGSLHLTAEGQISRKAFDLDWDALREAGRLLVADTVKLRADAVLHPQD